MEPDPSKFVDYGLAGIFAAALLALLAWVGKRAVKTLDSMNEHLDLIHARLGRLLGEVRAPDTDPPPIAKPRRRGRLRTPPVGLPTRARTARPTEEAEDENANEDEEEPDGQHQA